MVFHSDEAQELSERGENVILVRMETSPEDIQGMTVSEGILTSRGGQTSHAAVVARGMGKPCVVGAVAHDQYKTLEATTLSGLMADSGILADIKGIWRAKSFGPNIRRWEL